MAKRRNRGNALLNGKKPKNGKRQGQRSRRQKRSVQGGFYNVIERAFNALDHFHLPLARATAPYSVWRATTQFQSNSPLTVLGVYKALGDYNPLNTNTPVWSNVCAVQSNAIASQINAPLAATSFGFDFSAIGAGGNTTTLAPAAFTVQVRCPTALLSAAGTIYATRCKFELPLAGDSRTWQQLATQIMATQSIRQMTAAQLCSAGVISHALPIDVAELEDFRPAINMSDGSFNWDGNGTPESKDGITPCAMTPIVFYNPTSAMLDYVITCEFRLRFDPSNPAASTHTLHPASSPTLWNSVVTSAMAAGYSGIQNAEQVGSAVAGAIRGVNNVVNAVRGVRSLAGPAARLAITAM